MKLGLLTAAFPDTPVAEVADWVGANGFSMLEVACWPRSNGPSPLRRGVAHRLRQSRRRRGQGARRRSRRARHRDLRLGYYPNPLARSRASGGGDRPPRPWSRPPRSWRAGRQHVHRQRQGPPLTENFAEFEKVWPDIVRHAADHGVKIAIENCPMIFSDDEWPGGNNLMYAPATWRDVFAALDGDTLGLNLDPSHLVWQMIDYERAVRGVRPRIYHVHAKDMEIDRDGLYDRGVMSAGMGWQVPRLPGLGEIRWDRFISALYRRVRLRRRRRTRGPRVRGQRREGQGRLPHRPRRRRPVHRLDACNANVG